MPLTPDQIRAERTRTIEQIKRLFAVVMGLAVINCINNIYSFLKPYINPSLSVSEHLQEFAILFSQGITFFSLISLFYLGWERSLDRRYLQPDSGVPRPARLLFDLFSLALTALWFVILANSFPSANLQDSETRLTILLQYQKLFVTILLIMYAIDTVLLLVHLGLMKHYNESPPRAVVEAHLKWIAINLVTAAIIAAALRFDLQRESLTCFFEINALSTLLVITHVIRFFVDFLSTYEFYYPPETIK